METNIKQISTALVKAQSEMSNAKKGSSNPFFKSKYADLNSIREACIPVLNNHGITVLQPIVYLEGKNFVKTLLLHESGESLDSYIEIIYAKSNDAQSQGSGISYARRYGLQSFLCIGADDDDGTHAVTPKNIPAPIPNTSIPKQDNITDEAIAKAENLLNNLIPDVKDLLLKQKDFKATPEGANFQSGACVVDVVKNNHPDLVNSFYRFIKKK
jgi:hypothetical protein